MSEAEAQCAICGGHALELTLGELSRCRDCHHIQYIIPPSTASSIYTEEYFNGGEYAGYLAQESALRKSMRRHLEQMATYGELRGSLLEVGCAYGLFVDEARSHFDRVLGVDICAGPVASGRARLALDLRCDDFPRMDIPAHSFDAVCMWDTIEHLPNPAEFLGAARRSLKPGGRLYLTTGDVGSLNARVRGRRWRQIHPPSHLQYFSRETMTRALQRCDFELLGIETASYYHTLFNVLSTLRLRGGPPSRAAGVALRTLGEGFCRRVGGWINLGDIMFVAARAR